MPCPQNSVSNIAENQVKPFETLHVVVWKSSRHIKNVIVLLEECEWNAMLGVTLMSSHPWYIFCNFFYRHIIITLYIKNIWKKINDIGI